MSGKEPADATLANKPMIACQTIQEFEVGAVYNMTCFINKVTVAELSLRTQATGEAKYTTSI